MQQEKRYIYLIKSMDTGAYKIGVTGDVQKRLWALVSTVGESLEIVHCYRTRRNRKMEAALREKFNHLQIKNYHPTSKREWFNLGPSALDEFLIAIKEAEHQWLQDLRAEQERRRKVRRESKATLDFVGLLREHGYDVTYHTYSGVVSIGHIRKDADFDVWVRPN